MQNPLGKYACLLIIRKIFSPGRKWASFSLGLAVPVLRRKRGGHSGYTSTACQMLLAQNNQCAKVTYFEVTDPDLPQLSTHFCSSPFTPGFLARTRIMPSMQLTVGQKGPNYVWKCKRLFLTSVFISKMGK